MANQFSYKLITQDGTTFDLDPKTYSVDLDMDAGLGLPPIEHATQDLYKLPGALLRSIRILPRVVTITTSLNADCRSALHTLRAALWNAMRWNRTTDDPPQYLTLRYESDLNRADLHAYYAGDVFANSGGDDKVGRDGFKLIAYDPAWYGIDESDDTLIAQWSAAVDFLVRKHDGQWDDMGDPGSLSPAPGSVHVFAFSPDGNTMYMGGWFSTWNGVANTTGIVAYDMTSGTWSALGTGVTGGANKIVYSLAVAADGTLYAAGPFTQMGGIANTAGIAKWNGAAWSALGTGLHIGVGVAVGYGLAFDSSGNLYLGGSFDDAGGIANTKMIAKWNGAAWTALGTGATGGSVFAVAVDKADNVYAGGDYTLMGGIADTVHIAKWNGSAWSAMGTGTNAPTYGVTSLAVAPDGSIYIGGDFTTVNGQSISGIARWNHLSWFALGTGVSGGYVRTIVFDSKGALYAAGTFTSAGGLSLDDRIAKWNGTAWSHLDIDLPGAPEVFGVAFFGSDLYLGFSTTGTAYGSYTSLVPYGGDMIFFPIITVLGPGTLQWIENVHSGKRIVFDCYINAGETATIDLSPGVKTFTSDWRGNLFPYATLLPLSDFATFALEPDPIAPSGNNSINVYMTGTTGATDITMTHRDAFLSADKAVS